MTLTVIVSTYNSPRYLALVLDGLIAQRDSDFECIIADDGSTIETRAVFDAYSKRLKLIYSWQADRGFRLAASRNQALAIASGSVVAFLDGDCVPSPFYVEDAKRLARPGIYIQGHRVILSQEVSNESPQFSAAWLIRNRKHLSNIRNGFRHPFPKIPRQALRGVRGCNMIFTSDDLHKINGFDEEFTGWGHEDKDIVSRFYKMGGRRIDARGAAVVFHLFHPEHPRTLESDNLARALSERPAIAKRGCKKNAL